MYEAILNESNIILCGIPTCTDFNKYTCISSLLHQIKRKKPFGHKGLKELLVPSYYVIHLDTSYTVNSEIFARILFSRKALKYIFAAFKLRD